MEYIDQIVDYTIFYIFIQKSFRIFILKISNFGLYKEITLVFYEKYFTAGWCVCYYCTCGLHN